MAKNISGTTEIIVNTLLRVSDRVVEISADLIFTRVWDRDGAPLLVNMNAYLGKKISDVHNSPIIKICTDHIQKSFETGKNSYLEYSTMAEDVPVKYSIRILPIHPDKNYLFIAVENITLHSSHSLVEDKWKLALDAAGDGLWDVNMETGNVFCSDKWHELFGYTEQEIVVLADWLEKIHPDDLPGAQKMSQDYQAGKVPYYAAEVRYRCKDGSYKWILSRGVMVSRGEGGKPLRLIGTHTDISERKMAEEKYHSLAQMLSKLINNLQSAILVTDEHGVVIFANEMFYDIYGIKKRGDQLVGTMLKDILEVHKLYYNDPEWFSERTEKLFGKKEMVLNEEWALKDGRTYSRDYIPLLMGETYKGSIWKLQDITEQKNIQQRFRQQRLFYERILNNISADIVVFDVQFRYMFINPESMRSAELREWMIGKTDYDYCRLRNKPVALADTRKSYYYRAIQEKKAVEWEEKIEVPDREPEYHIRRLYPLFKEDGTLDILIGYGLKITDHVKAREALQTSIDMFESAFNYSGIGMALISLDGKWLDVNNELCNMTGYAKEELQQHTFQEMTYPDDVETDLELVKKMLRKEIKTYSLEKRYISKDKKIVWALLTVSLVWNSDGSPKFFISQVVDITRRKELADEIYRKNTQLEATRISLVNKIAQLEELNHIIAHNLRGPAGNIKMLVDGMVENGDKPDLIVGAFTKEEALGLIKESSISLLNNLELLMEVAQIKLNKDIPYNECDISQLVNDIIYQLHGAIYEKKAAIKLNLEIKHVSYPKVYLESILYNLISNALKYSKADVPPEIIISTRKVNNKIQLVVKDNGLGIDMERYKDRVFKLNQVFHTGYDSKGIGLYITKTQVESLGGTIEVKSKPDEGSEFIVVL